MPSRITLAIVDDAKKRNLIVHRIENLIRGKEYFFCPVDLSRTDQLFGVYRVQQIFLSYKKFAIDGEDQFRLFNNYHILEVIQEES